jgi:hypothetical protein
LEEKAMAQSTKIHWHLVFLAAFGTLVLLVLADVLFVAYYAHLMDPAHDQAYYSQFAQNTAAPFVFFFAPLPIFLLMRWIGRKTKAKAMLHAVLMIAVMLILDISIAALAGQAAALLTPGYLLPYIAKIVAALLGGWSAQRETVMA